MTYGAPGCRCWTDGCLAETNPDCDIHGEDADRWEDEGGTVPCEQEDDTT